MIGLTPYLGHLFGPLFGSEISFFAPFFVGKFLTDIWKTRKTRNRKRKAELICFVAGSFLAAVWLRFLPYFSQFLPLFLLVWILVQFRVSLLSKISRLGGFKRYTSYLVPTPRTVVALNGEWRKTRETMQTVYRKWSTVWPGKLLRVPVVRP